MNQGLGIETREGDSKHFRAPQFHRGEYAQHELDDSVPDSSEHELDSEDTEAPWTESAFLGPSPHV